MNAFNKLQELAVNYLALADELNELVSAYFDGSNRSEAIEAYYKVRAASAVFTKAYNEYYDDRVKEGLNYEIAESVIY